MNDKKAHADAEAIKASFWQEFDKALESKKASKRAYLEELEELAADAQARIECVRDELRGEGDEE